MKFKIQRDEFLNGLIFFNLLLFRFFDAIFINAIPNEGLELRNRNESLDISVKIPAEIEEEGKCCVSNRYLDKILRSLPKKELLITTKTGFELYCEEKFARLELLSEEYLPVEYELSLRLNLKSDWMVKTLNLMLPIVSEQKRWDALYLMTLENHLVLAGTDGCRLLIMDSDIETPFESSSLPISTIAPLIGLARIDDNLEIGFSNNQIYFKNNQGILLSRLQNQEPPNIGEIMAGINNRVNIASMMIETNSLKDALSYICSIGNNYPGVTWEIEKDRLTLLLVNPSVVEVKDTIPITDGAEILFALNGKFLLDFLRRLHNTSVVLVQVSAEREPIKFTPMDGDLKFTFIIMPIRLR